MAEKKHEDTQALIDKSYQAAHFIRSVIADRENTLSEVDRKAGELLAEELLEKADSHGTPGPPHLNSN